MFAALQNSNSREHEAWHPGPPLLSSLVPHPSSPHTFRKCSALPVALSAPAGQGMSSAYLCQAQRDPWPHPRTPRACRDVELVALLQYLANQLKSSESLDLLVLKEILTTMTVG